MRQHCRFGCVICGCPIFQIDHMTPYERVHVHELANLTALCPNHHADKTSGRLAEPQVRAANLDSGDRNVDRVGAARDDEDRAPGPAWLRSAELIRSVRPGSSAIACLRASTKGWRPTPFPS